MNLTNIRAVIFDMDGLLVDSERLARVALVQTAGAFGIENDPAVFAGMVGLPEDGSLALLTTRFGRDFPAREFLREAALAFDGLVAAGRLRAKPGAADFLNLLQRIEVRRAVATSSAQEKAARTLSKTRLIDHFELVVTRTDVTRGKPHPDLYLKAAADLGCPVSNCIAFEDSYNGVRAAHAADMRVIMIPDLLLPTAEMENLTEAILPDLFAAAEAFRKFGLYPDLAADPRAFVPEHDRSVR